MFGGYNGRRRLKTTLAIIVAVLILFALIHQRSGTILIVILSCMRVFSSLESGNSPDDDVPVNIAEVQEPVAVQLSNKRSGGVMSTLEFRNSPFLVFELIPFNFIPIMVISKAANIEVRDAIRRTWGFYRQYRNNTLRIKIFFVIGTDDFMTQRITMEQNVFDDVIQVTIPDVYSFSAYKELSAMIWVRKYLPDIRFYIKTDDDVILNMNLLVDQLLPTLESLADQQLVIGWFGSEHVIHRGAYQKFIEAVIPASAGELHYAMNLLYAVTASASDRMISALRHVEVIEYPGDPFVTGILRDAAHVQMTNLAISSEQLKYELANGACKEAFEKSTNLLLCTTSLHVGSSKSMPEYFDAWNEMIGEKQPQT